MSDQDTKTRTRPPLPPLKFRGKGRGPSPFSVPVISTVDNAFRVICGFCAEDLVRDGFGEYMRRQEPPIPEDTTTVIREITEDFRVIMLKPNVSFKDIEHAH